MIKIVAIALIALFFQVGCSNQTNLFPQTSVEDYLNQVVDFMEANHFNRANINWVEFRTNVQQKGSSFATIREANEAVTYALELLGDQTSYVVTISGEVLSFGTECTDTKPDDIVGSPEIGYIKILPFAGVGVSAAVFAEKMHGSIRDQDIATLKGWIVDLRENNGGNMWPMIAGIGPILGIGTAGFFVDADLEKKPFGYDGTSSTFNDGPVVTIAFPYTILNASSSLKVAVLVDHSTSNAGESVVVAFSGRPLTRIIGATTCGRGGGNQTYILKDGSQLYLTTSYLQDRNELDKQGELQPDELVSDPALIYDKAVDWINQ